MRLLIAPPSSDSDLFRSILERFNVTGEVRSSRIQRDRGQMQLTLAVIGLDSLNLAPLSTALLERPEIADATIEMK